MPDDNSLIFWEAVAAAFANHPAVLFGLYSQPHTVSWPLWRDGGMVKIQRDGSVPQGMTEYHTPGLQKLLDVCRDNGAKNVVVAGGLDFASDLSGIVKDHALADPKGNGVVYDARVYPWIKDWKHRITPTADKYPVLVGEFGPDQGDPTPFVTEVLEFMDKHELHGIAWCLHPGPGPSLIADWKFKPTAFGAAVQKALREAATKRSGDQRTLVGIDPMPTAKPGPRGDPPLIPGLPPLKVAGKHLVTPDGKAVRLLGVNIPSMFFGAGNRVFESLDAATGWGANVIRLALAQDIWFGPTKGDGGALYRQKVHEFVDRAAAKHCYVLIELHVADAGVWGTQAKDEPYLNQMPDDNSITFWEDVAADFANHPAVLFGLYNEPHYLLKGQERHAAWALWRDGGTVATAHDGIDPQGISEFHTPGMQKLLEVCRDQGAKNVVVVGGLGWGHDLSGVVEGYALTDPKGNGVVYDTHIYQHHPGHWATRDREITPTAAKYPVLVGEFGADKNVPAPFMEKLLAYMDQHEMHGAAWSMHPGDSMHPGELVVDETFTPTALGELVKAALGQAAMKR